MTQWKAASSAAPTTMKTPRVMSAPRMPQNSTRCCSFSGTAKNENAARKTKMLSTDSAFSMSHAWKNSSAAVRAELHVDAAR